LVDGSLESPCRLLVKCSLIELLFLSLAVEALQGKTCQNSLLSGSGGSVLANISGEGVVPGEYFLVSRKLDTFCYLYLTVQFAPCRRFDAIPAYGRWTDRRTDGIAIPRTALFNASIAARCDKNYGQLVTTPSNRTVYSSHDF